MARESIRRGDLGPVPEIPPRPVQPSPQEILSRLAREMTQDPTTPPASLSDEDLRAMLDEIARGQGRSENEGLQSILSNDIMKPEEADGDGRQERKESDQDFRQRSLSEGLTVLEGGSAAYGYRRISDPNQCAEQIREELKKLSVPTDIAGGYVWRNKEGISVRREVNEAATVGGKIVLINNGASLPPRCVAGHEGFHYWKRTVARQQYIEAIRDNLNFSSKAFLTYQAAIAKVYLGEEVDLMDSKQVRALEEELFAYISGDIHEGTNDVFLRPMFHDFDAVKPAWTNERAHEAGEILHYDEIARRIIYGY